MRLTIDQLIPDALHQKLKKERYYFQTLPGLAHDLQLGHRPRQRRQAHRPRRRPAPAARARAIAALPLHPQAGERPARPFRPAPLRDELPIDGETPPNTLDGIPKDGFLDAETYAAPAFSLGDGTALGDDYIVRAMAVDEVLPEVARAECSALVLGEPLALPGAQFYDSPDVAPGPVQAGGVAGASRDSPRPGAIPDFAPDIP